MKTEIFVAVKRAFIPLLLLTAVAAVLLAQGISGTGGVQAQRYDPRTPPPLTLPQAYTLAMTYIGTATNQFWCVSGNCQPDWGSTTITHWEFGFTNTNGQQTNVLVFFDKTVAHREGATLVK